MKKVLKNKNNLKWLVIVLLTTFFSCDFTPRIHKEVLKAQKLIASQNYRLAINQYKDILKKNPPKELKIKILYQVGDLYSYYLAENKKAIEFYKKIKEISDSPIWLVKTEERLGELNFSYLRDYETSERSYKLLSKFEPRLNKQDFYQLRYGLSLYKSNKLGSAIEVLKEIEKNPSHEFRIKSLYYLGLIQYELKNWKGAIRYWKEYIKLEKRSDHIVQTKMLMGNAYETLEELKAAYNIYYSILGEYPNTDVIQKRLQSIYQRRISRKR